jgi:hypothetical protein
MFLRISTVRYVTQAKVVMPFGYTYKKAATVATAISFFPEGCGR